MNFSNNALSTLLTGIGPSATAFAFPVGEGARFNSNMRIIIWNKSLFLDPLSALVAGKAEIAHITTLVGDNATVVARAQEGTTALDFSDNTQEYGVCNAITAGVIGSFLTSELDPTTRYRFEEDFDCGNLASGGIGRNGFAFTGGGSGWLQPHTPGARGEFMVKTGTGNNNLAGLFTPSYSDQSTDGILLGNDPFTLIMRVALTNTGAPATGNKVYMFGLVEVYDPIANATPKGIYFYALNAGTIQAACVGASSTISDTLTNQSSNYHTFKIVSTGTIVYFYIDGVLVVTTATGSIPTTGMKYWFQVQNGTDGVAKEMHVDYVYCQATLAR